VISLRKDDLTTSGAAKGEATGKTLAADEVRHRVYESRWLPFVLIIVSGVLPGVVM